MTQSTSKLISEIEQLYRYHGQRNYGEDCTQYEHMAQCAWWADQSGDDNDMALAAFLHDIGHLIAEDAKLEGRDELGYALHDELAESWLRSHGVPESICVPIGLHVKAKRYLVARQPGYADGLSYASQQTLAQQGGPFSESKCKEFEASPFFERAIRLRELDEQGKSEDFSLPPLEFWLSRLTKSLVRNSCS